MKLATLKLTLLGAALVLGVLLVLTAPANSGSPVIVEALDVCSDCAQECWNDANTGSENLEYWQCIDDGYSQESCDNIAIKSYNKCVSLCNYAFGCTIAPKQPRLCKVGPCY